jgi:FlaA1/EpsC-like NDP-sugar epimerase
VKDAGNPEGDIEIEVSGLRPGEKLYEELLIGDNPTATAHRRILKAREDFLSWDRLRPSLNALRAAAESGNVSDAFSCLTSLVSGYRPAAEPTDWLAKTRL